MQKLQQLQQLFDKVCKADFLAPLALRLYLAPIFWAAGMNKLGSFEDTVQWFGNPDWGLGLPLPWLSLRWIRPRLWPPITTVSSISAVAIPLPCCLRIPR